MNKIHIALAPTADSSNQLVDMINEKIGNDPGFNMVAEAVGAPMKVPVLFGSTWVFVDMASNPELYGNMHNTPGNTDPLHHIRFTPTNCDLATPDSSPFKCIMTEEVFRDNSEWLSDSAYASITVSTEGDASVYEMLGSIERGRLFQFPTGTSISSTHVVDGSKVSIQCTYIGEAVSIAILHNGNIEIMSGSGERIAMADIAPLFDRLETVSMDTLAALTTWLDRVAMDTGEAAMPAAAVPEGEDIVEEAAKEAARAGEAATSAAD